jgi:hypothetical protein
MITKPIYTSLEPTASTYVSEFNKGQEGSLPTAVHMLLTFPGSWILSSRS